MYEDGVYEYNFHLINMRQDYMFGYFQGGKEAEGGKGLLTCGHLLA